MTQLIIDADAHITEPADVWTARVPAKYLDHVPKVGRADDGKDTWFIDGAPVAKVGGTAAAGWPEPFPSAPATYEECHPAAHDAHARLRYMDEAGIWAQVLYPNVAGFASQRFLAIPDDELKLVCVSAYNDFLRDWASADHRRLITIMSTPFWDVDAAVAEIERCAATGHRGVLFTGEPARFGLPHLGDAHWDRFWAAAAHHGMPIQLHLGSGDMTTSFTPERIAAHGTAATYAFTSTELFLKNAMQVADLLLSGVLPRHPDLKVVSVESGIGWIPFVKEAVDHSYLEGRPGRTSEWELLPSEYLDRQVYACYWFETVAPRKLLDELPVDNILFETDFPHPTCLYGDLQAKIDAGLGEAPADVREKFLWDNAARLYGVAAPST